MNNLKNQNCTACHPGAPSVIDEEIPELHLEIPEWELVKINNIKRLKRSFTFNNYIESVKFTNKVAELAENEGHHPEIILEWGKVTVFWWTHKINNLHKNDFIMAAKTDQLYKK